MDSPLMQDLFVPCRLGTVVEEPPLDGSKVSVLIKTSDAPDDFIFHSLRLTDEETRGKTLTSRRCNFSTDI